MTLMTLILLLGSFFAFVVAFSASSVLLSTLALLLGLVGMVILGLQLLAARVGSNTRDVAEVLSPQQLQQYREQAQQRKQLQADAQAAAHATITTNTTAARTAADNKPAQTPPQA